MIGGLESEKETIVGRRDATVTSRRSGDEPDLRRVALRRGALIGRYIVLERIGAGGMGVVYAAYDPSLDRRVALKLVGASGPVDMVHRDRVLSEARALAKLDHPNVVGVFDVGVADERPFLAMEFVEGQTLRRWQEDTAPDWRRIVEVFLAAARGLAAAHAVGLVHRDFKPDNVIISADGRVRVLDFGLAVPDLTASGDGEGEPAGAHGTTSVIGTPAYMAPEQFARSTADTRSDQFSFCVSLWEALYGLRPFRGEDLHSLAASVLDGKIVAPRESTKVPNAIEAALRRGLAKDPEARFPSMHELIDELARIAAPRPPWLAPAAMAAVITSVAAAAIVMVTTSDERDACPEARERLAGIWDDSTRATVETAVRKHESVLGAETWTTLAPMLDTYASRWAEQRNEACLATHERHEQSEEVWALRIACLDRRLQSLRAVVEVLAEGRLAVVTNAVEATERLPALDQCADGQRLQQETPPPAPEIAGSVGAVEATLVRATTFRLAAQYDDALAVARTAVDDALEIGYAPTVSVARAELGRSLINVGLLDEARDQLVDAFFAARHVHDEWRAAEAATELVACTSGKQYHLQEGALWARHAEVSLRAAGDPAPLRFRYLRELADLRRNEGHPREATEIQREALALLASVEDVDTLQYALGQAAYARGLAELGRLDEALASFDLALAGIRARLGHTHPRAADMLAAKAVTRMRNQELEPARAELEEALRYYRAVLGENHPSVASTMGSLAGTYPEQDPTAVEMLEQVVAQQKRLLPGEHPDIAITEVTLGTRLVKIGRTDEGIAMLRDALARLQAVYGLRHPTVGAAHHNLGVAYFGAKRLDDARLQMSIALEIDRDRLDRSHPGFVAATSNVAFLDMLLERYADAIPLLVESLELQALRPNRDLPREVSLASALVRAYLETGEPELAEAALERGYALAEQTDERSAKSSLDAERAALLWARGEKQKALDLAREVRAGLDPQDAVDRDDTIPVLDSRIAKWRKELEGG